MNDHRTQLRLYLIQFRLTWPGVILLNASVPLIHLWAWFIAPAVIGLSLMVAGLVKTHAMASPLIASPQTAEPAPED